jgi:hypothetical protein
MMPCPICACTYTTAFFRKADGDLAVCFDCRHIFRTEVADPEVVHAYNELAGGRARGLDVQANHKRQARELASLCSLSIGRMAMANIGASDAAFSWNAMHSGAAVAFEVTWSREARNDGIGRQIAVLTPDEFDDLIPDGFLDALRFPDSLARLVDPVATLRRQAAKLRVGGMIHVTQPNLPVLTYNISVVEPHGADQPTRMHFFSPLSFLRLVQAAGLTVVRFHTTRDAETGETRYADYLDPDHSERSLEILRACGEEKHGPLNNYPSYTGFEATAHLRKPPPPPPPPPPLIERIRARLITPPEKPIAPADTRREVFGVMGILSKRSLDIPIR